MKRRLVLWNLHQKINRSSCIAQSTTSGLARISDARDSQPTASATTNSSPEETIITQHSGRKRSFNQTQQKSTDTPQSHSIGTMGACMTFTQIAEHLQQTCASTPELRLVSRRDFMEALQSQVNHDSSNEHCEYWLDE